MLGIIIRSVLYDFFYAGSDRKLISKSPLAASSYEGGARSSSTRDALYSADKWNVLRNELQLPSAFHPRRFSSLTPLMTCLMDVLNGPAATDRANFKRCISMASEAGLSKEVDWGQDTYRTLLPVTKPRRGRMESQFQGRGSTWLVLLSVN